MSKTQEKDDSWEENILDERLLKKRDEKVLEPQIFWAVDDSEKPPTPKRGGYSPLMPVQKEKPNTTLVEDGSKTPTGRSRLSLRKSNLFSRKRKETKEEKIDNDDLIKRIHEASREYLQNNVETYKRIRDEQRARGKEDDCDALFSPKTALERAAARYTPSKRTKFFPNARQYSSMYPTTPKRTISPKTSTPIQSRVSHLREKALDLSPVSSHKGADLETTPEDNCSNGNKEAAIEKDLPAAEDGSGNVEKVNDGQTGYYIIPDDSWDLSDEDSF